jgi:hypothetical protein
MPSEQLFSYTIERTSYSLTMMPGVHYANLPSEFYYSLNDLPVCYMNRYQRKIWNPIDFQGHRSRSPGHIFSRGDTPHFALPLSVVVLSYTMQICHLNFITHSMTYLSVTWTGTSGKSCRPGMADVKCWKSLSNKNITGSYSDHEQSKIWHRKQ